MKICLVGKAGSGKTTIAKHYEKQGYKRLSFAEKVKQTAKIFKYGEPVDKRILKDRELLQKLGTDVGRWYDENLWVNYFALKLFRLQKKGFVDFIVDDARFINEVEFLRKQGFIVIRVTGRSYQMGELNKHISETELDSITPDFEVDNSGSLEATLKELEAKYAVHVKTEKFVCNVTAPNCFKNEKK